MESVHAARAVYLVQFNLEQFSLVQFTSCNAVCSSMLETVGEMRVAKEVSGGVEGSGENDS
jgi:hypothetical protein